MYSVLIAYVPHSHQLAVSTIYLRGKAVNWILQILHVWHIANQTIPNQKYNNGYKSYY
jgi:hypothetical protein